MLPKRHNLSGFRGESLIEVVVVASILSIALVALVSLTTTSLARNRLAKERIVATRLAQEGLEWAISERNRWGFDELDKPGVYCLNTFPSAAANLTSSCGGSWIDEAHLGKMYTRSLEIIHNNSDQLLVKSTVSWRDVTITLQSQLSRWEKE